MADPPKPATPTAAPGSAAEPSMEEILASIRRILSEDEGTAAPSGTAAASPPAAEADDGVLQLTEQMLAPAGKAASAAAPPAAASTPASTAVFPPPSAPAPSPSLPTAVPDAAATPLSFHPAPGPAPSPVPLAPPAAAVDGLLDASAAAAAAAALGQLARGASPERAPPPAAWPLGAAGLSVEDIVRQELRPLLSAWLNANLPRIVEEAVAREMERVRARLG